MKNGTRIRAKVATAATVAIVAGTSPAWAAPQEAPASRASCMEVEVNGERAPAYDCLSQQLSPTKRADNGHPAQLGSEAIINRPSNQLGLYNRAATEHRMGNTFGTSVLPQRPDTPPR